MHNLAIILAIFAAHFGQIDGQVVGSVSSAGTWNGGGQSNLVFKNNDKSKTTCYVRFSLDNAGSITSKWNFDQVSGKSNEFTLPSWLQIAPGAQYTGAGLNYNGNTKPSNVQVLETKYLVNGVCGGSSSGSSTSGSGSSGSGSSGSGSGSSGSGSGGSSSSGSVSPQASCMGCLATTNTDGPINSVLNQPFTDSIFTFYGGGGRGACGLDSGIPTMSAAASGDLFIKGGQWKDACRSDGQYMLDDPICKGICIKIDYNGKSLTVPINNQCPECASNHVDLSIPAFNYLEPRGGEVGIGRGATLTYLKCPADIPKPC